MDGGLVVQIKLQIIYWLDIRDPGWGSRCLKTDLKTDMEWIACSHSDTNLSPPQQRNCFFLKKPNMCSVFGAIQLKLSASVISFQTKAARQWFILEARWIIISHWRINIWTHWPTPDDDLAFRANQSGPSQSQYLVSWIHFLLINTLLVRLNSFCDSSLAWLSLRH